ncbi:MAG: hypothetical protein LBK26_02575 [Rickettsiales bacterium]|jgi:hypothetical protein|nr:hypothetical protein [Rickettsiales bacterium]
MLQYPVRILSCQQDGDVCRLETDDGPLEIKDIEFLKRKPTIRERYFIASCNYMCKKYGSKWCTGDFGDRGIENARKSVYGLNKYYVPCKVQFYIIITPRNLR